MVGSRAGVLLQSNLWKVLDLCEKGALASFLFVLPCVNLTEVVAQMHFGICLDLNKTIPQDTSPPSVPPLIFLLCFKMCLNPNPPPFCPNLLNPPMNGPLSWDRLQWTLLLAYCTSEQAKIWKHMAKSRTVAKHAICCSLPLSSSALSSLFFYSYLLLELFIFLNWKNLTILLSCIYTLCR